MNQWTVGPVETVDKFIPLGGHVLRLSSIVGIKCQTNNTFIILKDGQEVQCLYMSQAEALSAMARALADQRVN